MIAKTKSRVLGVGASALVLTIVGAYVLLPDAETAVATRASATSQAEVISLGEKVYASQCALCHGVNLEGQPNWRQRKPNGRLPAPPHDETGHTWHHDDATLFRLTKYGLAKLIGQPVETDMPAYEGVLSDEEISAVLAYIKSRWPESIRKRQVEITAKATPAGS